MNKEAYQKLILAENLYLLENGWSLSDRDKDLWSHDEHERKRKDVHQGHAVNIQKQYDRIYLQFIPLQKKTFMIEISI